MVLLYSLLIVLTKDGYEISVARFQKYESKHKIGGISNGNESSGLVTGNVSRRHRHDGIVLFLHGSL